MPKVLPSQLTDEEILALLESNEEVEVINAGVFDYNNDIVPFLSFYNITPGDTKVSKKLVYKLYKTYSKEPLTQHNFTTQIGNYIEHDRDHFLVNIDQFAISQHIYEAEKTRDKTKSLSYQKHFEWFLSNAGVETGVDWVEGFILFYIYKDFCKSRRVHPKFGYVNFHKFLKLHLPYKRIGENRSLWFRVNDHIANKYTEEEKNVIREARTKKEGGSKKEASRESETTTQE
jgi:hypothetical protein